MHRFTVTGTAPAPVEDVWKLLFDPARFVEWWVAPVPGAPLPQHLRTDRDGSRVVMSCQVSATEFVWQLAEQGDGTQVTVRVAVPPEWAELVEPERVALVKSLAALGTLAADH